MGLKKRSKVSAEFNMSSLTDIIFLLLIFFMLTSSMVVPNALNLKLPGKSRSTSQAKYPPVEVRIDRSGKFTMDGRTATRSEVERRIRDLKREKRKVSMIIYPHDKAPNQYVVSILDIAYRYQVDSHLGKR